MWLRSVNNELNETLITASMTEEVAVILVDEHYINTKY